MGILLLSHPSWAWLKLAPIMLVEPSTACSSEAATKTPSARDVLSGKVGSRWAKRSTPSLCSRHGLREGDCFYQSRDTAGRGRLPVGFGSKEGMAKPSKSSQPQFQGNTFKIWSVTLICNPREFSLRSDPTRYRDEKEER